MPIPYICPFCKHAVQIANPLPVGRPVKCPGCKKLYQAGAPGAVGTGSAPAPNPKVIAASSSPVGPKKRKRPLDWLRFAVEKIGPLEVGQMLMVFGILFLPAFLLSIFALNEWRVGSTATSEPLAADLAQLENGPTPENTHIKIGPHNALYFAAVYSYTTKANERPKRPDANTKVDYAFYPIISTTHPYFKEIQRIQEKYRNMAKPPDDIEWPKVGNFRVLVQTWRFRKVGDIPDEDVRADSSVQGLVVNKISSLNSSERDLIKEDFPDVNFDNVLILQEGRRPSSAFFYFFLALLSVPFWLGAFGVLGIWLLSRAGQRLTQRFSDQATG